MAANLKAPIIIKRKKVIAAGHHGGAWKVAYADFVTAMMAFFLLMWLLGATNEKQRKGIADYFNPTIPIMKASGGGDGAFGGDSIFSQNSLASQGTGASTAYSTNDSGSDGGSGISEGTPAQDAAREAAMLSQMAQALSGRGGESMVSALLARHIVTRLTDEGLIVEVFDLPDAPLFLETAEPTDALESIVLSVAEVFRLASNEIATQTHTAAVPLVNIENPVWEQSTQRADRVRQMLQEAGLDPRRMQRITGFADSKPTTRNPLSVRNNRVEMILLRSRL